MNNTIPTTESYATFWEPIAIDVPSAPVASREPADAYQDFVNQTEDTPVSLYVEQIDI